MTVEISLTGKVALVTGGSRGIGWAIAERLAGAGAAVAILGRDEPRAREAAGRLGQTTRATAVAADMADSAQVERAVESVERDLGPIDILVNNAGLTRDGILVRMSEADWDAVLDANLKGAFTATRLVTRGMMKRRYGRVINISSVVGITGNKGQANYAASKAGLIGFTKAVAKELASRNVLVNAVAPGFIETDMTRALPEAARNALLEHIPLGRLGDTADVAGAVLFLASDLAGYITGHVLVVDGGMVM
ncbi:MAG TPA: 3-oxoacyl-[acyl-carrier-protein] reductase [Gemmatimonadales bacterium]|nr:3-oxoacyl-[acyl-carrier-protein] reductase [Gemmatimonadales bacterium]